MPKCKSCGAPIIWEKTVQGANVPLDPPEKRYISSAEGMVMVDTWLSHFATCPDADKHRRAK